jgi:HemX protein
MNFAGHTLFVLAALGYILAFVAGLPALRRRTDGAANGKLATRCEKLTAALVAFAFACQNCGLVLQGLMLHRCPMNGPADVLEIVAWSLVIMYALVGAAFRTSLLGLFTAALAALFSVGALLADGAGAFLPVATIVLVHAWLSLFSYGAFGLLGLTSAMYLTQLHGLRKRRWAPLFELLPSLRELERVNLRLLSASVIVYTVAVALGVWWDIAGPGRIGPAKLALASLVWLGYAAALALKLHGRLHGRRLAVAALFLFALAVTTLIPVAAKHVADLPAHENPAEAAR